MNENFLKNIFLESCYKNLLCQNSDGSMPSGHNGPYNDPETPVRNTAHWIISFAKSYKLTKDKRFYDSIILCSKYLMSNKCRVKNRTFICRNKEKKDKCNGLIGQAWIIEGLMNAYELTGNTDLLETSKEVFLLHPFCEKRNMWHKVEPDGKILNLDFTFNHQLWFAMSGFLIIKSSENHEIKRTCLKFFNSIPINLKISLKGRIGQSIRLGFKEDFLKYNAKKLLRRKEINYMKLKEIGYHAFNTYAFSIIFSIFPNLSFFKSDLYFKIINYINSNEFKKNIYHSNYGFKYNPPGFEVLLTYKQNKDILKDSEDFINDLINTQMLHYNKKESCFSKNVYDKNTSTARIYELSPSI